MADLTKIWDVLNSVLEQCDEFVEDKVETVYDGLSAWLDSQVAKTETKFDDTSKKIIELGIRDKLIKKYPLETFPVD